jgi:hypothetical protein
MHAVVVVVTALLVVVVVIAAGLLLRSVIASPRREYRRGLTDLRQVREGHAEGFGEAKILVDPDEWPGANLP